MECDVAIVGAGVAGLNAAVHLHKAGKKVAVFEAKDHVGGRLATERYKGFLLDKGFQVYFTAYPEGKAVLNYATLGFHAFKRGALVRAQGCFNKLVDPRDDWRGFIKTMLFCPLAHFKDVWKFSGALLEFRKGSHAAMSSKTAEEALRSYGFSERLYTHFLRPFFGGVLTDPTLNCPSSLVDLTARMLMEGHAVLPAQGMQAIPEQIAAKLPPGCVHLNSPVVKLEAGGNLLLQGDVHVKATERLIACSIEEAASLLQKPAPAEGRSVWNVYFSAPESPMKDPLLVLNGEEEGLINHLAVLSDINPTYSPEGFALISVSVLGHAKDPERELVRRVRDELRSWYGERVKSWEFLKSYLILNAHPAHYPTPLFKERKEFKVAPHTYVCGDYLEAPSIHHSLGTGRKAAEQILRETK